MSSLLLFFSKRKALPSRVSLAFLGGSLMLTTGALAQEATPADTFVDSVGVNVHLHYTDTLYYTNFPLIKSSIVALGVRHVRDGMIDTTLSAYYERHNELGNAGITGLFVVSPTATKSMIQNWPANVSSEFEAYENPNEYDSTASKLSLLESFVPMLFEDVRSGQFANAPVVGPSLTKTTSFSVLGDLNAMISYGNMHNYFAGRNPGTSGWGSNGYGSLAYNLALAATTDSSKPIYTTETGYGNTSTTPTDIPESVSATYFPRLLLEQWNAGIKRTYIYELLSEGGAPFSDYGLLRADGSQKPAFHAIANLLTLLRDPGASFVPSKLAYSVTGGDSFLHKALFQKRDGSYYLALWLEKPSYDVNARTAIQVAPEAVTVSSPTAFSSATAYQFDTAGNVSSSALSPGSSFSLNVSDRVMLLKLVTDTNKAQVNLAVVPSSGGSVTSEPESFDLRFAKGTSVVLTAKANPGYVFTGYSGEVPQSGSSVALTVDGPVNETATFRCTYSVATTALALTANGGTTSAGYSSGAGCTAPALASDSWIGATASGSAVRVTASKNTGDARTGKVIVGDTSFVVTQASGNVVTPVFVSNVSGSSIWIDGVPTITGSTVAWHKGETHTLSVSPAQAVGGSVYLFRFWQAGLTGGLSGASAATVTVSGAPLKYSSNLVKGSAFTASASSGGQVNVSSPGTIFQGNRYYYPNDVLALYAGANRGCTFTRWSGASTSTDAHIKLPMTSDQTIKANFVCK